MNSSLQVASPSFSERSLRLLERVEHRRATSEEDRELVFRTRYIAYFRQGLVNYRADAMIFDELYDLSANHYNIMTYVDGDFVSTFRIHVGLAHHSVLPSLSTFGDVLNPLLTTGCVIVDPTRIAAKPECAGRFPELPYITIRAAWLAAEHFRADVITSTCIDQHQAFYKRVFGFESLCGPRPYPNINRSIVCMALHFLMNKERVERRYPIFCSTYEERRSLFGPSVLLN